MSGYLDRTGNNPNRPAIITPLNGDITTPAKPKTDSANAFAPTENKDEKNSKTALYWALYAEAAGVNNADKARTDLLLAQAMQPLNAQTLIEKGTVSQGDIFNAAQDAETQNTAVAEYIDPVTGRRTYIAGDDNINNFKNNNVAPNVGRDNWRVTNIGQVQREMVNGINLASQLTGVPATLLGAMAGIESSFGKNQMSPTGAEGIYQQTSGYLKEWYGNRIGTVMPYLQRLAQAGDRQVAGIIADGRITAAEQDALSYNPNASALITALAAKNLGVDLNNRNNWWQVYCEHNVGRGGLNAIKSGGQPAQWIINANPLFYRNGNPAQAYANYVETFAQRYENNFSHLGQTQKFAQNNAPSNPLAGFLRHFIPG